MRPRRQGRFSSTGMIVTGETALSEPNQVVQRRGERIPPAY